MNAVIPDSTMQLLTEREVASVLNVSLSCLRKWRWQRVGPPVVKLSSMCRYPHDGLMAWIESQPKAGGAL